MSSPKRYVSLPVEIDAFQFDGTYENAVAIQSWSNRKVDFTHSDVSGTGLLKHLYIDTLEGVLKANVDDYIIKGTVGEYYPCRRDIFEKKYKEVQ
jgi:hypothetical protein